MNRNGNVGVITPGTYVRSLRFSVLRRLSDFLDPQDGWREVAVSIRRAGGEPRYSQQHVRRFEALAAQGRSPTIELLNDWGTTNCTVGDLVDILKSHWLLAAASLLLPESTPAETQQSPPVMKTEPNNSSVPTTLLQDTKDMSSSAPIPTEDPREDREPESTGFLSFSYLELEEITGKFDDRPTSEGGSRLGEGGFGVVYKGVVDGKPVAVKKLSPEEDFLAEDLRVQFHQEIQTLKTLKHMNLVDMVGFSCDGQFPCLVYAYMPHGSLLDRLACLDETPPLSWQSRCFIAAGSARGLQFLHNNHHVHRDVKSGNILLDENFVPKVSDFGLTRASAKHSSTTMMTERIVGTRAYMAPEALRGEITPKSDIYSFGVVLLEILSGLPPVDENREPEFLMELRYNIDDEDEELTLEDVLDKKMKEVDVVQAERMFASACNCLQDRKVKRPSIHQVLSELEEVARSFFPGCQPQESEA